MSLPSTPRGMRFQIAIMGRRNVGKSSLLNALVGQDVAIVSDVPGTTTDPVSKAYELLPFGPVTFLDTAGLDDEGAVGSKRTAASEKILMRADMVLLVTDAWGPFEEDLVEKIKRLEIPFLTVANKNAAFSGSDCAVSAKTGENVDLLKRKIIEAVPERFKKEPALVSDLLRPNDIVICVTPIDSSAPKGRLILPQVQVARDILDAGAIPVLCQIPALSSALKTYGKPALVITDSQAIKDVSAAVPKDVPLTTFSILFARFKGDLSPQVQGAKALDTLKDGDTVLIAEACSHHRQEDDIARVKIPDAIRKHTGKNIGFEFYSGHDFPEAPGKYALIVHCGACMITFQEMQRRLLGAKKEKVPITNYGVVLSHVQGVLARVVHPFGL